MRKFLLYTLVFSLPLLCLLAGAEAYVESLPNPSRDKHAWMLRHSGEVETLVLGNSHTFYGVSPSLLPPHSFSLAQVSQTYRYDLWLLRRYPVGKLRTLILPFSYMSLWEDFENQENRWAEAIRYRLYMDCDIHSRWGRYGWELMSIPTFREKLKSLYRPPQLSWDSLGWGTNYLASSRKADWDNGKERIRENTYTDTFIVRLNYRFLRDILTFCRKRNVRVLLISTPVSDTYRRNKDIRQERTNRQCLQALLSDFPEVEYLDFEGDSRFGATDFYDSDHLNSDGARKLSSILATLILKRP